MSACTNPFISISEENRGKTKQTPKLTAQLRIDLEPAAALSLSATCQRAFRIIMVGGSRRGEFCLNLSLNPKWVYLAVLKLAHDKTSTDDFNYCRYCFVVEFHFFFFFFCWNVEFTEAAGLLPLYSGQTFLAAIIACLLLGSDTSSFALWDIHIYLLSCFTFVLWVTVLLESGQ